MPNNSRITYIQPKDKFEKINKNVILKFEPYVVGIYCKLVMMSSGKSLSISFLSKKLNVSVERMRKTIVLLEQEGYITREALKDAKGHMSGWNYCLYAEPVSKGERTRAGLKKDNSPCDGDSRVMGSPCYGVSDNTEKGQDNIIIDNTISNNNKEIIKEKSIKEFVPDGTSHPISDKELEYIEKMKKKFPRIMKLEQPLTLEQAKKLKEKYDRDLLAKVMLDLENYKPLLKKYVSAYYVINKWCQMELDRA